MGMRGLAVWLLLSGCTIGTSNPAPDAGPPSVDAPPPPAVVPTAPGNHEVALTIGGTERKFYLAIPSSYDGTKSVPLLFVFHGFNHSGQKAAEKYGITDVAEKRGWITVFGDGIGLPDGSSKGWDAFACCGTAFSSQSDDVGYVKTILTLLEGALKVDKLRVYATGFSNGAMFTHRLGVELGDRLAAIAPVAGALSAIPINETQRRPVPTPVRKIPVLDIHGRLDPTVPFEGGSGDSKTTFDSEATSIGFWVTQNGCNATPATTHPATGVDKVVYSGCGGGSEVQLIATDEGLHAYLLLERYGTPTATVVLDFLERFTLPN